MFKRTFIVDGDTLEPSGGMVKTPPRENVQRAGDKQMCYEGDPVFCNACKTTGVTQCVPPFRPWTGPDGRQVNLDGDLCRCKCSTPPRLKASPSTTVYMSFDGNELAKMTGAEGWLAHAGHTTPQEKPVNHVDVTIQDSDTDQPITNRTVVILCDNIPQTVQTNAQGVARIQAEAGQKIELLSVLK